MIKVTWLALLALLFSCLHPAWGQDNEEQRRLFEVRHRQMELREARQQLQRSEELFRQGLVPRTEMERLQVAVERAQLNYQESLLSLLNMQPRLSVENAVKFQTPDGRKLVRLTVTNLTPSFDDSQFRLLSNFEGADPIPAALKTRNVQDVFISLKDPGGDDPATGAPPRGTTIGLPYEVHLPSLGYRQSRTLTFQLLRDVGSVVVAMSYKGQQRETDVQLQQADTGAVGLTSTQVSQEADLGTQATFDLRLERSTVDSRSFQLRVLNLPRQIGYSFLDPATEARLSQINFPAGVTQQKLSLRLFLPERAGGEIRVDRPVEFWAVALAPEQAAAFAAERAYAPQEIAAARLGSLRLELIPRGVGRIEVSAASLYSEIVRGAQAETTITLRNTGTRRLDNVQVRAETPLSWRAEITPSLIQALDIHQERTLKLRLIPPDDVSVGDYEVRIKTESAAYDRPVPTEDKIFRVNVVGKSGIWTTLALLGSLFCLIAGIIGFGARLARR